MQRLSVLQVLPELNSGGVERGTLEIGAALVAGDHTSTVLSNGGRLVGQLEAEGSRHITLPVHRKSLGSLRLVPRLRRLLQDGYDIVHVRSRLPAWLIYLAWRGLPPATRPRLVSTVHGLYSVNAYSAVMTRGERVIAISACVRNYILENYPRTDPERIRLIHRGVDPQEFLRGYEPPIEWRDNFYEENPELENKVLLALPGRITRWKGQETFLRLIAQLNCDGETPVHGLLIGGAERKQQRFLRELKALAEGLGISDELTFLGHRADMREVLSQCRVTYNLSTHPEPFGRTMIEALSLGIPVVAWNYGGAAESVAELFPLGLVPPQNEGALAETTRTVLREPEVLPKPNTFLRATMQRATLAVYEELAASPR
ncbi:MAG: glycosyltransferase family 4 protein [Pseudomonadota bacterium]